jgi:hypothetical protein
MNSVANIASARPYRRLLHWLRAASPAARRSLFAAGLMLDSFDVKLYSGHRTKVHLQRGVRRERAGALPGGIAQNHEFGPA